MGVSFDAKATKTRALTVDQTLIDLQNRMVAFKINSHHLYYPLDPVMKAMKELDAAIDKFHERTVEPGADVETSAPGLN